MRFAVNKNKTKEEQIKKLSYICGVPTRTKTYKY